jgi:serine/threonine protein kinase
MLQTLISGKYKLTDKLAIGPFYEVFKAQHHKNQTEVTIKLEKRSVS